MQIQWIIERKKKNQPSTYRIWHSTLFLYIIMILFWYVKQMRHKFLPLHPAWRAVPQERTSAVCLASPASVPRTVSSAVWAGRRAVSRGNVSRRRSRWQRTGSARRCPRPLQRRGRQSLGRGQGAGPTPPSVSQPVRRATPRIVPSVPQCPPPKWSQR